MAWLSPSPSVIAVVAWVSFVTGVCVGRSGSSLGTVPWTSRGALDGCALDQTSAAILFPVLIKAAIAAVALSVVGSVAWAASLRSVPAGKEPAQSQPQAPGGSDAFAAAAGPAEVWDPLDFVAEAPVQRQRRAVEIRHGHHISALTVGIARVPCPLADSRSSCSTASGELMSDCNEALAQCPSSGASEVGEASPAEAPADVADTAAPRSAEAQAEVPEGACGGGGTPEPPTGAPHRGRLVPHRARVDLASGGGLPQPAAEGAPEGRLAPPRPPHILDLATTCGGGAVHHQPPAERAGEGAPEPPAAQVVCGRRAGAPPPAEPPGIWDRGAPAPEPLKQEAPRGGAPELPPEQDRAPQPEQSRAQSSSTPRAAAEDAAGAEAWRCEDDRDMALRSIMKALEGVPVGCILQVRRIKHLGFNFSSFRALRAHFMQFGLVARVLVSQSRAQMRVRPASLGFVIMADADGAAAALAWGAEQVVCGFPIRVGAFVRAAGIDGADNDDAATSTRGGTSVATVAEEEEEDDDEDDRPWKLRPPQR